MQLDVQALWQLDLLLPSVLQDSTFVLSLYQSVISLFRFWQRRKLFHGTPVTLGQLWRGS